LKEVVGATTEATTRLSAGAMASEGAGIDDGCRRRSGLLSRAVMTLGMGLPKVAAEVVLNGMHGVAGDE
jgi:hypothetical protein